MRCSLCFSLRNKSTKKNDTRGILAHNYLVRMCCIFTRLGIMVKLMLKRHAESVPFIENFYLSKNIFLIKAIIAMIQIIVD